MTLLSLLQSPAGGGGGAPIAYASSGAATNFSVATTTFSVPCPATVNAGDLLILHVATNGGTVSSTPPTGWTEVYRDTVTTNPKGGLWLMVAAGTEGGTNVTVTTSSTTGAAQIHRYENVDQTTPQDATATDVQNSAVPGTADITVPGLTTVTDGAFIIYANASNSTSLTHTSTSGDERGDLVPGGATKGGAFYDEEIPTAGATGDRTITQSSARAYWAAMLALRPANVGGGGGLTATPTGIATAEAFGTAEESGELTATPGGIVTGEAFGTANAGSTFTATATAITTAEAFGTPVFTPGPVTCTATGIASGETFGTVAEHWELATNFDDGTAQGWTANVTGAGAVSITTAARHDGTHGAHSDTPAATVDRAAYTRTIPAAKQVIIRGWWRVTTEGGGGSNVPFARVFDGATRIADVYRENGAGTIWLRMVKAAGGSNYWFTSTGQTLALNTWAYVSFQWGLDGKPEVYINGTRYISQSQVPTDFLAASDITTAWLGSQEPGNQGVWDIDTVEVLGRGYATGEARQHPILTGEAFGTPAASGGLTATASGIGSAEAFGTASAFNVYTAQPGGIASVEAFGTPTFTAGAITATPGGIASAEAFGTPAAAVPVTYVSTAIPTAEQFGTPAVTGALTSSPGGIGSAEGFGSPTATVQDPGTTATPTGIPTGETFGIATQTGALAAVPGGIASGEAFGTPNHAGTVTAAPSGVGSAEAFGTPTAVNADLFLASGIGSAEVFGTPSTTNVLTTVPTGITSGETFGVHVVAASPTGIPSAQAVGTPAASIPITGQPGGIASAEAFGTPAAEADWLSTPTGIPSAEAFGSPLFDGGQMWAPTGIASAQAFGTPVATVLAGNVTVTPTGIPSGEAFGTAAMGGNLTATPSGISSAETWGNVRAEPHLTSTPTGIPSGGAMGTGHSWTGLWVLTPIGIPSGEAWQDPTFRGLNTLSPVGISSGEAFGTAIEQGHLLAQPPTIGSAEAFGTPAVSGTITATPGGIPTGYGPGFPTTTGALTCVVVGIASATAFGSPSATVLAFTGRDLELVLVPMLNRWHVRAKRTRLDSEGSPDRLDSEKQMDRMALLGTAGRMETEGGL